MVKKIQAMSFVRPVYLRQLLGIYLIGSQKQVEFQSEDACFLGMINYLFLCFERGLQVV